MLNRLWCSFFISLIESPPYLLALFLVAKCPAEDSFWASFRRVPTWLVWQLLPADYATPVSVAQQWGGSPKATPGYRSFVYLRDSPLAHLFWKAALVTTMLEHSPEFTGLCLRSLEGLGQVALPWQVSRPWHRGNSLSGFRQGCLTLPVAEHNCF